MRTQRTTKGNRDAGSSCLCDRGLHRYLQNFEGGGFEHPKPPPSRYATDSVNNGTLVRSAAHILCGTVRVKQVDRIRAARVSSEIW